MGFNNPDMPWSEVEALLSGRKPSDHQTRSEVEALLSGRKPSDHQTRSEVEALLSGRTPDHRSDHQDIRQKDGRAPGSPSWNAGGDGPAWSRKRQPYQPPDPDATTPLLRPGLPKVPYA